MFNHFAGRIFNQSSISLCNYETNTGPWDQKMVPALYPEAPEFQVMPEVFATGFLVGFLEWACMNSVIPHLDWTLEQTVGTHVNISHLARIFHKGGPV